MDLSPRFGDRAFAIREHQARRLHWDLRLQVSGELLLSWFLSVPPNLDPARPLRAFQVGDHKMAYLLLERIIPDGEPGAGPTVPWDKGVYRIRGNSSVLAQFDSGHLRLFLSGGRLRGHFSLRWAGPREEDWLWVKEEDLYADPSRQFPNVLTPEKIRELENKNNPKVSRDQVPLLERV